MSFIRHAEFIKFYVRINYFTAWNKLNELIDVRFKLKIDIEGKHICCYDSIIITINIACQISVKQKTLIANSWR